MYDEEIHLCLHTSRKTVTGFLTNALVAHTCCWEQCCCCTTGASGLLAYCTGRGHLLKLQQLEWLPPSTLTSGLLDGRVSPPHSEKHCWELQVLIPGFSANPARSPLASFRSNWSHDGLHCTDTSEGLPRLCCSNSSKQWSTIILKYYSCSWSNCLPWSRRNVSPSTVHQEKAEEEQEEWMYTVISPRTSQTYLRSAPIWHAVSVSTEKQAQHNLVFIPTKKTVFLSIWLLEGAILLPVALTALLRQYRFSIFIKYGGLVHTIEDYQESLLLKPKVLPSKL